MNLTGAENPTSVAALRYDSYPLDTFLFGPDDPSKLTDQGRGLLVNMISFAVSLRETPTTQAVSQLQAPSEAPLAGGYHYPHEPTLKAAYAAVHSVKSALDASNWSSWSSQHQSLIEELLDSLFIDYGSQAGFMNSVSENTVGLQSTAEGLWLAASMGLLPRYHSDKIVSYLSFKRRRRGRLRQRYCDNVLGCRESWFVRQSWKHQHSQSGILVAQLHHRWIQDIQPRSLGCSGTESEQHRGEDILRGSICTISASTGENSRRPAQTDELDQDPHVQW